PIYDYCCKSIGETRNVLWGQNKLADMSIERVKPAAASSGSGKFKCDNVCALLGKVCVGVGLTDSKVNFCYAVSCHSGSQCTASKNNVQQDCITEYPYKNDSDRCTNPETYSVGYTSCLCY
ncbi:MAG: hypothetical protein U9Q85_01490, partial [Patescibacteria group bacterium]|nr:hypothetical protein [Patescibacteria group bacterium]